MLIASPHFYGQPGAVPAEPKFPAALLDRLTRSVGKRFTGSFSCPPRCDIIETRNSSWRFKNREAA